MKTGIELTPREQDVYRRMSLGEGPTAISRKLSINYRSVTRYIASIRGKLKRAEEVMRLSR
jgi:DNA-binding CsgD family transcriptional regulator